MVKDLPAMWKIQVQSPGGKISWRREWQPISVLLLGEFHGQRSLAGHKESDTTEHASIVSSVGFVGYMVPLQLLISTIAAGMKT